MSGGDEPFAASEFRHDLIVSEVVGLRRVFCCANDSFHPPQISATGRPSQFGTVAPATGKPNGQDTFFLPAVRIAQFIELPGRSRTNALRHTRVRWQRSQEDPRLAFLSRERPGYEKSSRIGLVPKSARGNGRPAGPGRCSSTFRPRLWKIVATTSGGVTGRSAG